MKHCFQIKSTVAKGLATTLLVAISGVATVQAAEPAATTAKTSTAATQDPQQQSVTSEAKPIGPSRVEVPTPRSAHASAYDEDPKEAATATDTTRQHEHSQANHTGSSEGVPEDPVREGALSGSTGLSNGSPGIDD